MADYNFATKVLHHFVLDNSFVKKIGFDIDCFFSNVHSVLSNTFPPVFISGLARAGTTILLEALYSSGIFSTLTYRDMPFITSPYLWSKFTNSHRRYSDKKERAHQDGLYINFDSPEAFEEVFWITFAGHNYVRDHWLEFHAVEPVVMEHYKKFVSNVLSKHHGEGPKRYLAKNNNNILRIHSLKNAFPDAVIIVPFRNPLEHAQSLLNQHKKFLKVHSEEPFSLKYMSWLGHFEFGKNFKPIRVEQDSLNFSESDIMRIEFWMDYWTTLYNYLFSHHARDVIFWDYDEFCRNPENNLRKLGNVMSVDPALLLPFGSQVKCSSSQGYPDKTKDLPNLTVQVYEKLKAVSL